VQVVPVSSSVQFTGTACTRAKQQLISKEDVRSIKLTGINAEPADSRNVLIPA